MSRVKDFLGDERSWKDWFASLTTAVIQMYPHLADAMERVAVRAESIQDWNSLDDWIDGNVRDEYEGPLWAVLVQHTGGEARTVVLNQNMNQGNRLLGWWKSGKLRRDKLKVAFGEALSEVVQIAISTGMLPSDLQDKVFEMGNAGDLKYHKVRDVIVGIMNNWARVLEPTPMDIGQVGGPVREPRAVTTSMEETNSPLST